MGSDHPADLDAENFACLACSKSFPSLALLQTHMISTRDDQHICQFTYKIKMEKKTINVTFYRQAEDLLFLCNCLEKFHTREEHEMHLRTLTEEQAKQHTSAKQRLGRPKWLSG
jgi:transcription elongation factor Elf1